MTLDLLFPARGEVVPTDHAYPLYAALSAAVPVVHDPAAGVRFLAALPDDARQVVRAALAAAVSGGGNPPGDG